MDKPLQIFLEKIKGVRSQIRELKLFGSRARGNAKPDSDYDLFLVVDKKNAPLMDALYDAVIDVLLDTGRLISLKVFSREEFNRLSDLHTPFMQAIGKEGVAIG